MAAKCTWSKSSTRVSKQYFRALDGEALINLAILGGTGGLPARARAANSALNSAGHSGSAGKFNRARKRVDVSLFHPRGSSGSAAARQMALASAPRRRFVE